VATEDQHPSVPEPASSIPHVDDGSSAPAMTPKGASRRRFARVGAGATGVLLTLHSQPGMACTFCGVSTSAAVSAVGQKKAIGTLSHHGPNTAVCRGIDPISWANDNTTWPNSCPRTDLFSKHFQCKGGSGYDTVTCGQIMKGATCDSSGVARYILAAYLNVLSGRVNFLNPVSLREVWYEFATKNYYAPMAGQQWYATDIKYFLARTMD
jgi:hypothetical protein